MPVLPPHFEADFNDCFIHSWYVDGRVRIDRMQIDAILYMIGDWGLGHD